MSKYENLKSAISNLEGNEKQFLQLVYIEGQSFHTAALALGIARKEVSALDRRLEATRKQLVPFRNKWRTKRIGGDFWAFLDWMLNADQKCAYCGVTEADLAQLHAKSLINKRTTRGRTLELDRKISSESYTNIENLTYSCYWCNNAKTDTFDAQEAKLIGEAIRKIWAKRLADDN